MCADVPDHMQGSLEDKSGIPSSTSADAMELRIRQFAFSKTERKSGGTLAKLKEQTHICYTLATGPSGRLRCFNFEIHASLDDFLKNLQSTKIRANMAYTDAHQVGRS